MNTNTNGFSLSASVATIGHQIGDGMRLMVFALMLSMATLSAGLVDAAEPTVNINTATAEQLSAGLAGVGLSKAYRIVEYREAHGPFATVDELVEVKGIGQSTVEKNREFISIE